MRSSMPLRELSVLEQREELVRLASAPGANKSELARRFGIDRSNLNKWLKRFREQGAAGLRERSRRPQRSPTRSDPAIEAAVLRVRADSNNAWGGRKIEVVLQREGLAAVPRPSTITGILRRHGKLVERQAQHPGRYCRFERAQPNELWQMDFKGHFALQQGRCHALGVLDDHSRYAVGLEACADEQDSTVRQRLTGIFRRYGLPAAMLMDNGSPWGDSGEQRWTRFTVWLMRLGIKVTHGRPYHPQTQGKEERFNRTVNAEVLQGASIRDLEDCQARFDRWRPRYNHQRPHQALGMVPPGERYRASERRFPEQLPAIEYGDGDLVRKVDINGGIHFDNRRWRIGKPFRGELLALRPTPDDGAYELRFAAHRLGRLDLRRGEFVPCGYVDNADALPTSPQGQPPQQA